MAGPELEDAALLRRMDVGNEAALGELYDRYGRLIFSVAYGVVQNRETAEEITLDVFTRAWQHAGSYDPGKAKVSTWLTRMARNRAIDRLRREKVRPLRGSLHWGDLTTEPVKEKNPTEKRTQLALDRQRVRAAVASLPPEQQEVLGLAFFGGYSHSEIAEELDLPLGTVKGRIRGGMKKLRRLLGDG